MSFEDPHRQELASEDDLITMETLAADLADTISAEVIKDFTFSLETGATISLGTVLYEDEYQVEPAVIIGLDRADDEGTSFLIGFDSRNEMTNIWFPTGQLDDALLIAGELMQDQYIDPQLQAIVRTIQNILLYTAQQQTPRAAYISVDEDNLTSVHIADQTRALVDKINGSTALSSRDYGVIYNEDNILKIITRKVIGATPEILEEYDDIKSLTVETGKDDGKERRIYSKYINGERLMEVNPDDDYYCEVTDEPLLRDVTAIIEALVEVSILDTDLQDRWLYPVLQFGFNFENASSQADLVKEVFRTLQTTTLYELPELCPDDYPPQPNYLSNQKKQQRIEKYMGQKITASVTPEFSQETTVRRSEVVDPVLAVRHVVDYLAETRHPVAQMVAQLYDEYGLDFGFDTIEKIATEVVQQTHWKYVQAVLSEQVSYWRATLNRLDIG